MDNMRQVDLDASSLAIVQDILNRYVSDRPVFVFGSRARGAARRRSDLDLAVGGADALTLQTIADMKQEFTESDLPIFVDILDINSLTPGFLARIEHDFIPMTLLGSSCD